MTELFNTGGRIVSDYGIKCYKGMIFNQFINRVCNEQGRSVSLTCPVVFSNYFSLTIFKKAKRRPAKR
jgi:hypothetical protein